MRILYYAAVLLLLASCAKKQELNPVPVVRFDQAFQQVTPMRLAELKQAYPYLFPVAVPDSVWLAKGKSPFFGAVDQVFGDFEVEKLQLARLFQQISKHDTAFQPPKTLTLISELDPSSNVVYVDSLLFISLEMYLGRAHEAYQHFPKYISYAFDKEYLMVDVAQKIAERQLPPTTDRTFLAKMIAAGKLMYLMDAYLPAVADAVKMGYAEKQLDWVAENEAAIWKYFIENELLFSTDSELVYRFINPAPFSKFYLEIDQASPGRVGVWFGWQVVRSFMEKNKISTQKMVSLPPAMIFKKSKYKPKK